LERVDDVRRDSVAEHDLTRELVVERRALRVVRDERHRRVDRRDLRPRAPGDDVHEADVVDVLMRDDHELQVLDRAAVCRQGALELVQGAPGVRSGVDERERLVVDQVAVDAPDRERRWDGEAVDARLCGRCEGHRPILTGDLSSLR
jgi:hypothetical protein